MKPPVRLFIILALLAGLHHAAAQVNFALTYSPSVGMCPQSVTVADVNGDGRPDLISPNFCTNTLSVLINTGGGFMSTPVLVPMNPGLVVASDVNSDGSLDLVSVSEPFLSVMTNDGSGGFTFASSSTRGAAPLYQLRQLT